MADDKNLNNNPNNSNPMNSRQSPIGDELYNDLDLRSRNMLASYEKYLIAISKLQDEYAQKSFKRELDYFNKLIDARTEAEEKYLKQSEENTKKSTDKRLKYNLNAEEKWKSHVEVLLRDYEDKIDKINKDAELSQEQKETKKYNAKEDYISKFNESVDEKFTKEIAEISVGKKETRLEKEQRDRATALLKDGNIKGLIGKDGGFLNNPSMLKNAVADISKSLPGKLGNFLSRASTNSEALDRKKAELEEAKIKKEAAETKLKNAKEVGASDETIALLKEQVAKADENIEASEKGVKVAEINRQKDTQLKEALISSINKLGTEYDKVFNEAEDILNNYMGKMNARLQGSEKNYSDIMDKINFNLMSSPYTKVQDVIKKVKEASDKGIAYNIEQRAFLGTISEKIAQTFDAFDGNLTRLIKLQQADSTAARLAMEAALTKFYNNMFEDSSYLNDGGGFDNVTAALIDASASMSKEASAEFEFIVQKWMGALSSLGMSTGAIETIAQGINYIATGDVKSLGSNSELQTLLAMSASNANMNYADLLVKGLDASSTNKLLKSMVEYLKTISEQSDNNVVRSAYKDVYNMSISDLKAVTNLNQSDIESIAKTTMSYGDMNQELQNQFLQVRFGRTSLPEMLSNIYHNTMFTQASEQANNPFTWAMQKLFLQSEGSGLDFAIPFINAMGFGVDLNTTVVDIMKVAANGVKVLGLAGQLLQGLSNAAGGTEFDLDAWGNNETTQRGTGITLSTGSFSGATSGSVKYVANTSMEDMKNKSLTDATDDAEKTKKITNKNSKSEHTFDDFYSEAITSAAKSYVVVKDIYVEQAFDQYTHFLSVKDEHIEKAFKASSGEDYIAVRDTFNSYMSNSLKTYDEAVFTLLKEGVIKTQLVGSMVQINKGDTSTYTSNKNNTFDFIGDLSDNITYTKSGLSIQNANNSNSDLSLGVSTVISAIDDSVVMMTANSGAEAQLGKIHTLIDSIDTNLKDSKLQLSVIQADLVSAKNTLQSTTKPMIVKVRNDDETNGGKLKVDTELGGTTYYGFGKTPVTSVNQITT